MDQAAQVTSPSLGTFKTWLGTALSNPVINVSMPRPLPTRVIPSSDTLRGLKRHLSLSTSQVSFFQLSRSFFLSMEMIIICTLTEIFLCLIVNELQTWEGKTPSRLLTGCEVPLQRCGAGGSSASAGERWLPLCFSCCPRVCSVLCYFHKQFFFFLLENSISKHL